MQKKFDEFTILQGKNITRYSATYIRDSLLGRNTSEMPTLLGYTENYYISTVDNNTNLSKETKKITRKQLDILLLICK